MLKYNLGNRTFTSFTLINYSLMVDRSHSYEFVNMWNTEYQNSTTINRTHFTIGGDPSNQGHSKVFTTGQARFNPEHYVTKCMGG